MAAYIAYLRKDRDSDFGVEFPDLPGCISAGATLEEAKAMASEALAAHVALLQEEGEPVPEPSTIDQLMDDPRNRSRFLVEAAEQKLAG